jgi:hypothetical protein
MKPIIDQLPNGIQKLAKYGAKNYCCQTPHGFNNTAEYSAIKILRYLVPTSYNTCIGIVF